MIPPILRRDRAVRPMAPVITLINWPNVAFYLTLLAAFGLGAAKALLS